MFASLCGEVSIGQQWKLFGRKGMWRGVRKATDGAGDEGREAFAGALDVLLDHHAQRNQVTMSNRGLYIWLVA